MSSIRERIAALNATPQENATASPAASAKKTTETTKEDLTINVGSDDEKCGDQTARRKSLTISERIALMKSNSAAASSPALSSPAGKTEMKTVTEIEQKTAVIQESTSSDTAIVPSPTSTTTTTTSTAGDEKIARRGSMTIAERIALMKSNSAAASSSPRVVTERKIEEETDEKIEDKTEVDSKPSTSPSPPVKQAAITPAPTPSSTTTIASSSTSTSTSSPGLSSDGGDQSVRRKSLTISERIALMKSNSAAASSPALSSPAGKTEKKVEEKKEVEPKPLSSLSSSPSVTLAPVSVAVAKTEPERLPEPPLVVSSDSTSSSRPDSDTNSTALEVEPPKLTVAQKIAAMKAKSAAAGQQQQQQQQVKKDAPPLPLQDTPENSPPPPKKLSVVEKMAALKAKSEAEAKAAATSSLPSPSSGATDKRKSLSIADRMELMKQKSMSMNDSFDSPTRPKSATIASTPPFHDDDDIFDRPVSMPRKKLDPSLMARASMVMPGMMMPGMTHPGLSKRSSTGDIMGGMGGSMLPRSSSTGSTRINNEPSESGEITHSTMTRARTSKKKRKSSVNSLSLLKSDMEALQTVAGGSRVSTVKEEDESDRDTDTELQRDNNTHSSSISSIQEEGGDEEETK